MSNLIEVKDNGMKNQIDIIKGILNSNDFIIINDKLEITRDGILKILSSLPISYEMETLHQEIDDNKALVKIKLTIEFNEYGIKRSGIGSGICEKKEVNSSLHNMLAKAESRAFKRAAEICLGGIINVIGKDIATENIVTIKSKTDNQNIQKNNDKIGNQYIQNKKNQTNQKIDVGVT